MILFCTSIVLFLVFYAFRIHNSISRTSALHTYPLANHSAVISVKVYLLLIRHDCSASLHV